MSNPNPRMTIYQRIAAKQKVVRPSRINEFYQTDESPSINRAVALIPETASLVMEYSKLRTRLVLEGGQNEITQDDILEHVYGMYPIHRYKSNGVVIRQKLVGTKQ